MPESDLNPLLYDTLTGLPNRTLLQERITHEIESSDRHGTALALVHLDPFPISEINTALGYDVGDQLLIQLGERLRSNTRKIDTVAHLNSDEFSLLLPDVADEGVMHLCSKLTQWFEEPFEVAGEQLFLGLNMGVAIYPSQCGSASALLRGAMLASREAKRSREPVLVFHEGMQQAGGENLRLFGALREAIQNDRLNLNFQPKVDLASGKLAGVEVLSRWDERQISPGRFIPVAESTGLIREFTRWMVHTGMKQAARWQQTGLILPISLNVSVRDLLSPTLAGEIKGWADELEIQDYPLVIEVTESAVMQHSKLALKALERLHDSGFAISIDDFGTGYSSLAYLRDLPASELKIDQSFILGLVDNVANQKLVRAVIKLAHEFDLKVVGEGVETREAFEMLADFGCDVAQGYYISRGLSGDELVDWVNAGNWQG